MVWYHPWHMNTSAQQIPPCKMMLWHWGHLGLLRGRSIPKNPPGAGLQLPWLMAGGCRALLSLPMASGEQRGGMCTKLYPPSACPTWMVTMRGSGCRVFAPPSMAIPRVGALLDTRIRHEVGSRSPGCGQTAGLPREARHHLPAALPRSAGGQMPTPGSHPNPQQVRKGLGRSTAAL